MPTQGKSCPLLILGHTCPLALTVLGPNGLNMASEMNYDIEQHLPEMSPCLTLTQTEKEETLSNLGITTCFSLPVLIHIPGPSDLRPRNSQEPQASARQGSVPQREETLPLALRHCPRSSPGLGPGLEPRERGPGLGRGSPGSATLILDPRALLHVGNPVGSENV